MAGLARRLAPAAALGGLAVVIVGVADPALPGHTDATATGAQPVAAAAPEAATTDRGATDQATTDQATSDQATTDQSTSTPNQAAADTATCTDEVTGDSITTRWGPVQVVAKVDGSKVCEVHAVQWPASDGKSQMISSYAIPQLDASATSALTQGTQFQYVSGATYTSDGYVQSLQSILDAL